MLLARAPDASVVQASPDAHDHVCPACLAPVIAKCGDQVIWHWAHAAGVESCDPWAESEGEWHLGWKLEAQELGCALEVTLRRGDEWHRADIVRPDKVVIEVQHSPLGVGEALDREGFYRRHGGLIWLFDANERWWDQIEWGSDATDDMDDADTAGGIYQHMRIGRWDDYSTTLVELQAPMFWDTPVGLRRVVLSDPWQGSVTVSERGPVRSPELFLPAGSSIVPVAQEIPLVPSGEAWRYTAVRCFTCGARPTAKFNDGSPLFTCHQERPDLHVARTLDGSLVEVA